MNDRSSAWKRGYQDGLAGRPSEPEFRMLGDLPPQHDSLEYRDGYVKGEHVRGALTHSERGAPRSLWQRTQDAISRRKGILGCLGLVIMGLVGSGLVERFVPDWVWTGAFWILYGAVALYIYRLMREVFQESANIWRTARHAVYWLLGIAAFGAWYAGVREDPDVTCPATQPGCRDYFVPVPGQHRMANGGRLLLFIGIPVLIAAAVEHKRFRNSRVSSRTATRREVAEWSLGEWRRELGEVGYGSPRGIECRKHIARLEHQLANWPAGWDQEDAARNA